MKIAILGHSIINFILIVTLLEFIRFLGVYSKEKSA